MKLLFTKPFILDYRRLPERLQKITDERLELLMNNPPHPSLKIRKMRDPREIWEGRLDQSYRFTFQIQNETYVMRRIGTHDLLKNP